MRAEPFDKLRTAPVEAPLDELRTQVARVRCGNAAIPAQLHARQVVWRSASHAGLRERAPAKAAGPPRGTEAGLRPVLPPRRADRPPQGRRCRNTRVPADDGPWQA